jgi:DNA (cytosine-5)-methyltransferase 1
MIPSPPTVKPGDESPPKAFYSENDPKAAAWLRELIADGLIAPGVVDERSITEIQPDDLEGYRQCHFFAGVAGWSHALRLAGWSDDRPVWTGSCPCQPFSTAGNQEGHGDARHLWPAWLRLIRERRPSTIFGEQVAQAIAFGWLDGVLCDLEAEDYACGAADLCAASVGADHIRQRIYFVAHADGTRQPDIERRSRSAWQDGGQVAVARFAFARLREWISEPELRIAVHGVHACPPAVRGYGNAIVPALAAQFILASIETTNAEQIHENSADNREREKATGSPRHHGTAVGSSSFCDRGSSPQKQEPARQLYIESGGDAQARTPSASRNGTKKIPRSKKVRGLRSAVSGEPSKAETPQVLLEAVRPVPESGGAETSSGNAIAIVPQVAAQFILAAMESEAL